MILIHKGQSNTFDLTLSEKSVLENPFFLFVFKNDLTKEFTKKVIGDVSLYSYRYNRFSVEEGIDITFNPTGYWHYFVYEQTSSTNTDETLATNLVEVGKLNVVGTPTTRAVYNNTKTYKGYGKGAV